MIRAAQFYRVPPWELLHRPIAYVDMAMMMMAADHHAQEQQEKHRR